jgi:type IV pilus biogenesis protein PilP
MGNDRKYMLALMMLAFAGLASAESTSEALTRIEAETMLLKAREKQLDVQANILNRQNEIALKQGMANVLPQISSASNPVLRGIEGVGPNLYATLEIGNAMVEAQRGDVLPNGMRVVSVSRSGVNLRSESGRTIKLAVTAHDSAASSVNAGPAQGPGVMLPLPPLAPAMFKGATK